MGPSRRSRGARLVARRLRRSRRHRPDLPVDVRERHPIVLAEGPRTLDMFVNGAAGLDPRQRNDVRPSPKNTAATATGRSSRRFRRTRPTSSARAERSRRSAARWPKAASPAHISPSLHISRPIHGPPRPSASVSSGFRPRSRADADNGPRISAWPTRRSTCATIPTGTSAARCGRTWRPRSRTPSIWFAAGPRARPTRSSARRRSRRSARARPLNPVPAGRDENQPSGRKLTGARTEARNHVRHDRRPPRDRAGAAHLDPGFLRNGGRRRRDSGGRAATGAWRRPTSRSRWAASPAAVEAYRNAPTPNVILIEDDRDRDRAPRLASTSSPSSATPARRSSSSATSTTCMLYRELMRRGVSEYSIAPVAVARLRPDDLRAVLGGRAPSRSAAPSPWSAPRAASAPRPSRHNVAWAIARSMRDRRGDRRPRSRLRHGRPRFQPGSAAGHRRRVFAPDRLDAALLDACCPSAPTISACSPRPPRWTRPTTSTEALRGGHRHPAQRRPVHRPRRAACCGPAGSRRMLLGADEIVIVADARPRLPAQRQEPGRPAASSRAERRAAAARPQQGRRAEAARDHARRSSPRRSAPSRSRSFRSTRSSSARRPTTAR